MSRRLVGLLSALVLLLVISGYTVYVGLGRPGNWSKANEAFRKALADTKVGAGFVANSAVDNPPRLAASSEHSPHEFDWPQWQGPDRTGISKETGLLQEWPAEGPKLVWQADYVGEGYSTPTIAGGRIFVMGNRGKSEYVIALSEADGGQIWSAAVGPTRADGGGYPGPRCSPTVDGERVYALGLSGDLLCLDVETGREKWRRDLRDFGGSVGGWGYCESPLIDGDKVICTPGGSKATLLALNKKNGEEVWKGPVPGGDAAHYASMIAATVHGKREYIQFLSNGVVGVADDGKFLWRYKNPGNGTANCSSPIFHGDSVFAASGYGTGGGLAKLPSAGAGEPEQVYFTKHMKNHHGGMLLLDGCIYGSDDSLLTCLDWETGAVKWSERKAGKGSLAAADGRIYFRDERGPMLLVEPNSAKYVEHGRFEPPAKSALFSWPHPVIANGKLYLRDQQYLFCYDVKKQ